MHEGLDGGERTLAQRATMRNVGYVFGRLCSERNRNQSAAFGQARSVMRESQTLTFLR